MRISDWSSDVCSSDLGRELDWRLKKFAQRLKRDALEGVRYRDDRLQISPVRTIATPDAEALADRLDAMMPRIRITELLHEVAQERSEEHTSELQSLMRISYAVFCLKKKTTQKTNKTT